MSIGIEYHLYSENRPHFRLSNFEHMYKYTIDYKRSAIFIASLLLKGLI